MQATLCDVCGKIIDDEVKPEYFHLLTPDDWEVIMKPPKEKDLCCDCESAGYAKTAKLAWDKNKKGWKTKVKTEAREDTGD